MPIIQKRERRAGPRGAGLRGAGPREAGRLSPEDQKARKELRMKAQTALNTGRARRQMTMLVTQMESTLNQLKRIGDQSGLDTLLADLDKETAGDGAEFVAIYNTLVTALKVAHPSADVVQLEVPPASEPKAPAPKK